MTELEALRVKVAELKAASAAAYKALAEAIVRLDRAERVAKKAASVALRPDAINIGGQWVANLSRVGPRKVIGRALVYGNNAWRWSGPVSILPFMQTDEDRAALLAAAGEWRK